MGYLRSEVIEEENIDVEMKTGGEQGRANVVEKKKMHVSLPPGAYAGEGVKHPPLHRKKKLYIYIYISIYIYIYIYRVAQKKCNDFDRFFFYWVEN